MTTWLTPEDVAEELGMHVETIRCSAVPATGPAPASSVRSGGSPPLHSSPTPRPAP